MSLVTLEEAQARVGDAVTQDQIDEVEEAWTAVFGPLTGERTETFYLAERRHPYRTVDGLYLSRFTDAVIVVHSTDDTDTTLVSGTDYRLLNHYLIERISTGESWYDTIAVTYSPNDEERVRAVIYDTLTYRQTPAGIQSIRIGSYSETFFPNAVADNPVLGSLMRRVLPAAGLGVTSPFRYAADKRDRTLIVGTGS